MKEFYSRIKKLSTKQLQLLALDQQSKLENQEQHAAENIAIIGIGCRFPGDADSPGEFWKLLRDGVDAITEIPPDRWNADDFYDPDPDKPGRMVTRWGGFVGDPALFDAEFFSISPREAASMDPQQRLLLEVCWESLEDSLQAPDQLKETKTGVFVGMCSSDYFQMMINGNPDKMDAYLATGNSNSVGSGRIAYTLGLQGPALTIDTACSSSLVAVHLACRSLLARECHLALAGGVNRILSPRATITLSRAHMLAPDGRCKTFDDSANGFVRAEGCGILALKRLSSAIRDGDPIRAVIRGSAINQDGKSNGLTAPSGKAQQTVISDALENAGVTAEQVDYVEAHGTGTSLGDPIEVQALAAILADGRAADEPVMLGSLKSNLGHMEAAAGIGGLIKTVLSLENRQIPPLLHLRQANSHIPWDELPVTLVNKLTPWTLRGEKRIAGVSSFGFSGTNAHVIVEEFTSTDRDTLSTCPMHVLTLSAAGDAPLKTLAKKYSSFLSGKPSAQPGDICFSAGVGRSRLSHKLAIVGKSYEDLARNLQRFQEGDAHGELHEGVNVFAHSPDPVFLFSGQGSQYEGMSKELYGTQATFRDALDRCAELLHPHLERNLLDLIHGRQGEVSLLDQTCFTQPAIFALQYSLFQLWVSWGIRPSVLLGHSIGEIAAACVAGVFSLEDAIDLVAARGRLSQELPRGGTMAAIRTDEETAQTAIAAYSSISIAANNGPENVSISGGSDEIEQVCRFLTAKGIDTQLLSVSQAFHSPLVEPMLADFRRFAEKISYRVPDIPILSTVTNSFVDEEIATPDYWVRHVRNPVQFLPAIRLLAQQNHKIFLELGPHTTLCGMGAACVDDGQIAWLPSLHKKHNDSRRIANSLAELAVRGVDIDWSGLDPDKPPKKVRLPLYPFERRRFWVNAIDEKSVAGGLGENTGNPLLGTRVDTARRDTVFESNLSFDEFPYLDDHRIFGTAIVPAPFFLTMAKVAALEIALPEPIRISDLQLSEALVVPEAGGRQMQMIVSTSCDGRRTFEIFSRDVSKKQNLSDWKVHASGEFRTADTPMSETRTPQSLCSALGKARPGEDYYRRLRRVGVVLGDHFQGVRQYWHGPGEAVAEVSLPPVLREETTVGGLSPSLLDCCLHTIGAALPEIGDDRTYLMTEVTDCRLEKNWPETVWCHAHIKPHAADAVSLSGDVRVFRPDGTVVAEFLGIKLQQANRETLRALADDNGSDSLYEISWPVAPNVSINKLASSFVDPPPLLAGKVNSKIEELSMKFNFAGYSRLIDRLEVEAVAYVIQALSELGIDFKVGGQFTVIGLAEQLGIVQEQRNLFGRMLEMLCEEEILAFDNTTYAVLIDSGSKFSAPVPAELVETYPDFAAETEFLQRCGSRLAAILRGTQDPLEILFPDGGLTEVTKLTQDSPAAQVFNTLVRSSFEEALREWPVNRPLRILEIGAGTGGTTSSVLPAIRNLQVEYIFTDVSPLFLAEAESKFAEYPFMRFAILDIESSPESQGFSAGSFDFVLAANVLHETSDINATLENVRTLLSPDGILLLLEGTGPQRWADLTFGLTEGWWRFKDTELRRSHPLLSREKWTAALAAHEFESTAFVPAAPMTGNVAHQTLFLSRLNDSRVADRLHYVLLSDRSGVAEQLAKKLQATGNRCTVIRSGTRFSYEGRGDAELDLCDGAHFEQMFEALLSESEERTIHVLHFPSLDCHLGDHGSTGLLDQQVMDSCLSALTVAKAVSSLPAIAKLKLWFITRGAVRATEDQAEISLSQVPLWGMARTFAVEHPERWGGVIDLDPELADHAEYIFQEISDNDGEDQIAFRHGKRHVARLVKLPESGGEQVPALDPDACYLVTGAFGGVGIRVVEWLVENGAKHLMLVSRSGAPAELSATIAKFALTGTTVNVRRGDVASMSDMSKIFADIDASGRSLKGVMHIAGIYDDRVLARLDWQRFQRVLAPKVAGSWNLHQLTENRRLDFFVLFGSSASFLGPAGLGNYAAGNAFLDGLALYRNSRGLPAVSIDWGPWAQTGMAEAVGSVRQDQWTQAGFATMHAEHGLQIMSRLMCGEFSQVGVLNVDWHKYLSRFGSVPPLYASLVSNRRATHKRDDDPPAKEFSQLIMDAPAGERLAMLQNCVTDAVMVVLGFDRLQSIDVDKGLFDLGMDSLTALELKNRLQIEVGRPLPSTLAFDHSSIQALSQFLAQEMAVLNIVAPEHKDPDGTSNERSEMSEDVIAELLVDKLRSLDAGAGK